MSTPCFYHPSRLTDQTCAQCGMSVCDECRQIIAEKPVCLRCVSAIRDRIAREDYGKPLETMRGAVISATPPAAAAVIGKENASNASLAVLLPPAPVRVIQGIVFGCLAGTAGAFVWEKVTFYSHLNIGYLTLLIGFGVGYGVLFGYRRSGVIPGIIGAVIAFAAQIFGYYLLYCEKLNAIFFPILHRWIWFPLSEFPELIASSIGVTGWVILAIGVYGGFKVPYRGKP